MGRGDKRTEKGKRTRGSYGKSRVKAQLKARARKAPETAESIAAAKTEAAPAEQASA
ncbi:MAG: 30S ribosomal protein THX [Planctomycetota bacterium]|jgi:ribosomal small subunit protein bTHX